MRAFVKRTGQILIVLLLVLAALGVWKREEVTRLLAVNSLFDEGRIVQNFSHMDAHVPDPPAGARRRAGVAFATGTARHAVGRSRGLGQGAGGDWAGDAEGWQAGA